IESVTECDCPPQSMFSLIFSSYNLRVYPHIDPLDPQSPPLVDKFPHHSPLRVVERDQWLLWHVGTYELKVQRTVAAQYLDFLRDDRQDVQTQYLLTLHLLLPG